MTTPDLRSDRLLDALRGYTRRQPWVKDDRLIVQNLFDSLDGAYSALHAWEVHDRQQQTEHQRVVAQLERRIQYLDNRVKEEQNSGFWNYLKMIAGPCR